MSRGGKSLSRNAHEAAELHHPDCLQAMTSPSSNPQSTVEKLPTYAELRDQEGHRFGRWRGWIEKRARERMSERTEERREAEAQGRKFGTGWDLPDSHSSPDSNLQINTRQQFHNLSLDRNPSIISSQNEHAAFARSTNNKGCKTASSSTQLRPILEPGPGAVKLTPSTSVHQIGSRFLPQFNSQPLCAIPLPLNNPNLLADGRRMERFLLVGTVDGLYVCDLVPALSHTVKTDSVSSTDSKIYKVWGGLGIHQLEIAVEGPTPDSHRPTATGGLSGIVIALTTQLRDSTAEVNPDSLTKSVKMWPLQSMINLIKFRAFSENSECLDLFERTTSSKRLSALSAGTQALAGLMSIFDKGKGKGKGKAEDGLSNQNVFDDSSSGLRDANHDVTSITMPGSQSRVTSRDNGHHATSSSGLSPTRQDRSTHFFVTPPNQSYLDLPLQWAKQSISLDLPRIQAQGPILFIKLSQSPIPGFNPFNDAIDAIDPTMIPLGFRPRSSFTACSDTGGPSKNLNDIPQKWLYLQIVTKQTIFVLTSHPAPKRTWHLCSEMAAPFSPKTVDLVCAKFPRSRINRSSVVSTTSTRRNSVLSPRSQLSGSGYGEEAVLVTMKEYAVVIKLSDLSVREIDLHGTISTRQSTSAGQFGGARKKTGGSLSGLANFENVQATLMGLPRAASGSSLSSEPILTGRKVGEGGGTRDDSFRVDSRRLHQPVNDRRWIGCVELLIPVTLSSSTSSDCPRTRSSQTVIRSFYLMTRGHLTYTVLSPLGTELGPKKRVPRTAEQLQTAPVNPSGIPCPILLKPIHTFTWRAVPVKVRAHIVATPSEWGVSSSEPRRPGTTESQARRDNDQVFCCLTAFTASGIEVQEGFISLSSVRSLWEPMQPDMPRSTKSSIPFFTPASQRLGRSPKDSTQMLATSGDNGGTQKLAPVTGANGVRPTSGPRTQSEDREVTDTSSYDYNAKIGFLCDGGAWFSTCQKSPELNRQNSYGTSSSTEIGDEPVVDPTSHGQGQFFWKESVGEWKIMYLCHDTGS
ncbi:hypothetical protein CROQUDRAFT_653260 [Cronartium quercuum f. sp. fusiforme G11]|uniref:Uncharacterized protein n=1 Tax=Cronartium quercuum f. sp. fusiforme G11 TaxID=708437 RepID=A0A9P6NSY2_9BASI|nr:hypothetical protein CROQUDRAFT_653260 [Cronartium quercuum f. sp. fusiforme G11]